MGRCKRGNLRLYSDDVNSEVLACPFLSGPGWTVSGLRIAAVWSWYVERGECVSRIGTTPMVVERTTDQQDS